MAKPKHQKQQEARWRKIRRDMIYAFLNSPAEEYQNESSHWQITAREKLWLAFLDLPRDRRATTMDGQSVPDNLQERLDLEAIKQSSLDLESGTTTVAAQPRAMRF